MAPNNMPEGVAPTSPVVKAAEEAYHKTVALAEEVECDDSQRLWAAYCDAVDAMYETRFCAGAVTTAAAAQKSGFDFDTALAEHAAEAVKEGINGKHAADLLWLSLAVLLQDKHRQTGMARFLELERRYRETGSLARPAE